MPTIGLPKIEIEFRSRGLTAIQRSERGIVFLLLRDTTKAAGQRVYSSLIDVSTADYSEKNMDYIRKTFLGAPYKVIVQTMATETEISDVTKNCKSLKFSYMAMPEATEEENQALVSWLKNMRDQHRKAYKLVTHKQKADHIGVVSFDTETVFIDSVSYPEGIRTVNTKQYTGQEYTCRIAGILAGLSLQRSATYYVLSELTRITEEEDEERAVNAGSLILTNDGEKIKIARGVNTFTSYTPDKGEDFSKIKIVEGMDLIRQDITETFNDFYVGKCNNTYDNKQLFLANINNVYFKELVGSVLYDAFRNELDIDMTQQRKYCTRKGEDVDQMKEMDIKTYPTGSNVYLSGRVKLVDAMEDLFIDVLL